MLNAVLKVKQEANNEERPEEQDDLQHEDLQSPYDRPITKSSKKISDSKFLIKNFDRDEGQKKFAKIEMKFLNLKKKYQ